MIGSLIKYANIYRFNVFCRRNIVQFLDELVSSSCLPSGMVAGHVFIEPSAITEIIMFLRFVSDWTPSKHRYIPVVGL